jgi:GT2 family glycosyltransferase
VTVVDDHSQDGTKEYIEKRFDGITIRYNKKNLGPSSSKNIGIKATKNEFIATLDNDVIVHPDWLRELVRSISKDEKIGACASKLLLLEHKKLINSAGGEMTQLCRAWDRGLFEVDKGQYNKKEFVTCACTAASLFRRSIFDKIGLFDDRFYYPVEDADLGLRINFAGYKVLYVPSSVVYHKMGATMGRVNVTKLYHTEKNRLRTLLKNFDIRTLATLFPAVILDLAGPILYNLLLKRDAPIKDRFEIAHAIIKAVLWNIIYLPDTVLEREKMRRIKRVRDSEILEMLKETMPSILFPDYLIQTKESVRNRNDDVTVIEMGKNDTGFLGYGWYPLESVEGDPKTKLRWTREEATAYLHIPDDEGRLCLDIHAIPEIIKEPVKGTIYLDKKAIGKIAIYKNGWHHLCFVVDVLNKSIVEVKIEIETTWEPSKVFKNRDFRTIGVGVRKVEWKQNK